jgi:hypothetical protein
MGIASVGPGVDLAILGWAIALRQHGCERIQTALDLLKIRIRDLLPLRFKWRLELDPKRFELLLIHLALLSRVTGYKRRQRLTDASPRLDTTTALVRDNGNGPQNVRQPIGTLA